jgi:DNA-binding transcriptional LysR family regulator
MDLDQLHTFLEVVRLRSFSKAALTCFRSQPAISAQVRQLEQELRASLFHRLGTRIELTEAGKIFQGYAEQILELRRRAQEAIQELEQTPRGELVIAANESTCLYVLPAVFAAYKKEFPNVELRLERMVGMRALEAVSDNRADFGFAQLPISDKRLQVARIHTDEIQLIVPPDHRLVGRPFVLPQDLVGEPLLLPRAGTTRSRLDAWFEPVEEEIRVSMELDSTEMTKRSVIAGLGLGFLASANCREEFAAGSLAGISLGPEPMVRHLGLVYRKDKPLSRAALAFIDITLRHACRDEGARAERRPAPVEGG